MKILNNNKTYYMDEFVKYAEKRGIEPSGKCVICGGNYFFGGNNPAPINMDENTRCCSKCNDEVVLPARLSNPYV